MVFMCKVCGLILAVSLAGLALAAGQPQPPRPALPTLPGRAWTTLQLGSQGTGDWGLAAVAPAGTWIDTWRLGIGPIDGIVGNTTFSFNGTVSVQGRCNDGTWLPKLNGTEAAVDYATISQDKGYTALWGRSGGWLTNVLGAGGGNDGREDIWSLNGANVDFAPTAKVVGYQLRTFSYLGDASFAFDSTV